MTRPGFPALSIAIGAASLGLTLAIAALTEADFGALTRDPAQQCDAPFYVGFLSNMGILFWMASATVTAFGAALLTDRPEARRARAFLIALTLLSGAFCVDDFFLLHERLPVSEKVIFGAYAVFLAVTLILHRARLTRIPASHLIVAGVFFAASIGIDLLQSTIEALLGSVRILLEDGAKFLGAVFWLNFTWTVTAQEIDPIRPDARSATGATTRV